MRRLYPLPVRCASALPSASFRSAVARDTLAVQLTLPLAGCVEDFHLQVRAPCQAHNKKAPAAAGALLSAPCTRRYRDPLVLPGPSSPPGVYRAPLGTILV